jgi:hypothetical protein
VLVAPACGSDDSDTSTDTPTTTSTVTATPSPTPAEPTPTATATATPDDATPTPTTPPTTTSTPEPPPEEEAGAAIVVDYSGGSVTGGVQRVTVPVGETVVLDVTADVADEVHVHGYDVYADVAPGTPAMISFDAAIPGIWEVELEGIGALLLELEIG